MKKTRKAVCFFLTLVMVCTMSSASVFATEGNDANQNGQTEGAIQEMEGADPSDASVALQSEPQEDETSETTLASSEKPEQLATPKVTALAGYKSIKLTWKKVSGADAYNVGIWNAKKKRWDWLATVRGTSCEKKKVKNRKNYKFRVMAVQIKESAKSKKKLHFKDIVGYEDKVGNNWPAPTSKAAVKSKQCVNRLRISFTMKRTKRANGQTLKKGSRVWAESFGLGKYTVIKKGKRLRVPRIMVRNIKASYVGGKNKKKNYSAAEAKYFLDTFKKYKGFKSTKKVIWVSSYHQHLYVFTKNKKGKYEVGKNWEICMGKKTTPSPTGTKKIHKKVRSHHGIGYWNCYSSMNALHGFRGSWPKSLLGNLASHGCIRNPNSGAKWIYKNCPVGTTVIVY